MEQENPEIQQEVTHVLRRVTPLSRYLAMALFIILPFLGGWIGYTYAPEKIVVVEKIVEVTNSPEEVLVAQPQPRPVKIILETEVTTNLTPDIVVEYADEGVRTVVINADTSYSCKSFERITYTCVKFDDSTMPGTKKVDTVTTDEIAGFEYNPEYEYVITVERLRSKDTYGAMDVSWYDYTLKEIVGQQKI